MLVFILFWLIFSRYSVIGQKVLITVLENGCFTNSSSAIAPIYNITNWKEPSPQNGYRNYPQNNVNFNDKDQAWIIRNSLNSNGPIDDLITDKRWEGFETHFTQHQDNYGQLLHFRVLAELNSRDFQIPFSIFAEQEAHVFLCETREVSNSRCYWFLLDAYAGIKSGFKECNKKEIKPRNRTPVSAGGCDILRFTYQEKMLLEYRKWCHYKIIKSKSKICLLDKNGVKVFQINRTGLSFQPRFVLVHTKRVNGLWKVHNFDYLYTTQSGKSTTTFSTPKSRFGCLSMMVALCVSCQVKLEMSDYESGILFKSDTISNSTDNKWFHYKTCFDIHYNKVNLTVNRLNYERIEGYWALNQIEILDQDKDLRFVKPKPEYWTGACQIMSSNEKVTLHKPNTVVLENWNKCAENELGEECVPCREFNGNYCQKPTKYCQLVKLVNGTITNKCYCPPGYEGGFCEKRCSNECGYGHGCRSCCDGCTNGCSNDPVSGKCNSAAGDKCNNNRFGEKCDKILGYYWFTKPPILQPGRTSCNVTMTLSEGSGNFADMKIFVVQYRKLLQNWIARSVPFKIPTTVTLTDLDRNTAYQIRVLGLEIETALEEMGMENHYVWAKLQEYNFTTTCKDLKKSDLVVRELSHSATIKVSDTSGVDSEYCTLQDYEISSNGLNLKQNYGYWLLQNLKPHTQYKLTLQRSNHKILLDVYTTEDKPQKPYDLKSKWTLDNQLTLTWHHPKETNGILLKFIIRINNKWIYDVLLHGNEDYQTFYTKVINDEQLELASCLKVAVTAKNSHSESESAVLLIDSPPPIPRDDVIVTTEGGTFVAVWKKEMWSEDTFNRYVYVFTTICADCDIDLTTLFESNQIIQSVLDSVQNIPNWNLLYKSKVDQNTKNLQTELAPSTVKVSFVWFNQYKNHTRYKHFIHPYWHSSDTEIKNVSSALTWYVGAFVLLAMLLVILGFWSASRKKNGRRSMTKDIMDWMTHLRNVGSQHIGNAVRVLSSEDGSTREDTDTLNIPLTPEHARSFSEMALRTGHTQLVKIQEFNDYVKCSIGEELQRQFETFRYGLNHSSRYGLLPQNKKKNRYPDIVAYDHSRVILTKIPGDNYSDYINATYIDGYAQPRAYIATQGPSSNTVMDFWRMVWQEGATHIVSLANLIEDNKEKFTQYWPDLDKDAVYGPFRVTLKKSEVHSNYVSRVFHLAHINSEEIRQMHQYHYTAWPDYGVPANPQTLLPLMKHLLKMHSQDFPLIVHCSAGVGRTGTVILCDICLRMAAHEGYVDVYAVLDYLRSRRCNMVHNVEQYRLAHLIILNCLANDQMPTVVPVSRNFKRDLKQLLPGIDAEWDYINKCQWQDDAMVEAKFLKGMDADNLTRTDGKDRFSHIKPELSVRVFLEPIASTGYKSGYINAVRVDGFRTPKRFITTQYPLPNTVDDLWRLVTEKRISLLVCLNEIPLNDPSCLVFWPSVKNVTLKPTETIKVTHLLTEIFSWYTKTKLELREFNREPRILTLLQFHGWTYPATTTDYVLFTNFIRDTKSVCDQSDKTLVTCYDGATASGVFIALRNIIEKIEQDLELDVCQAVRTIRTSRKQFINSKEQLSFLYKVAILYIQQEFLNTSNGP